MAATATFDDTSEGFSSEGFGGAFCSPAMAAFISGGHIKLFTYGGTWMSNWRQMSMIC